MKHSEEIDLKILASVLFRNYKILILTSFAFAIFAYGISKFVLPKKYESSATILPSDSNESSANAAMQGLASSMGFSRLLSFGSGNESLSRYSIILKSRTLAEMTASNTAVFAGLVEKGAIDTKASAPDQNRQAVGYIAEELLVEAEEPVLRVRFQDKSPEFARLVATTLVDNLQVFLNKNMTTRAKSTELFVEDRLRESEENLKEIEASYLAVQKSQGVVQFPSQSGLALSTAANLRSQLVEKELEINMYKDILRDSAEVKRLESERNQIQSQIEKLIMGKKQTPGSKADKAIDIFTPIQNIPGLGMEIARSERNYMAQVKVVELLRQQYEVAKIETKRNEPNFQVVDSPIAARWPSSPNVKLNAALGFAFGLFLSVLFVLFFSQFSSAQLPKSISKIVVVTDQSGRKAKINS